MRPAKQSGIIALLHGGVKRIHVEMGDDSEHRAGRLTRGRGRWKCVCIDASGEQCSGVRAAMAMAVVWSSGGLSCCQISLWWTTGVARLAGIFCQRV